MDWTVPYRMNRHTAITGGYSDFFPGPFIQESGAAEGIHFEYIMIQYTFEEIPNRWQMQLSP